MSRPPLRYRFQYAAVLILGTFFRVLPLAAAQGIAWGLGRLSYGLMKKRRREAIRRLKLVLGEGTRSEKEFRRIAWLSFRNMVFNLVDMLRIRSYSMETLDKQIPEFKAAIEHVREILKTTNGRGFILALPHCGNWDLAGSGVFLSGVPIFSVAGKQRNPYMNKLLNKMRGGHGMEILERGESGGRTYLQMLRKIRGGSVFAILPDSRSFTPALPIQFLGGTANLARGMGLLALQAGVPILPLVMRRTGWRHFTLEFFPLLTPNPEAEREDEELRLTQIVISHFDEAIRKTPEQWFWYNKRWVLDPPAG